MAFGVRSFCGSPPFCGAFFSVFLHCLSPLFVRSIRNETIPNEQNPCCGSFVVNWNWNRKWEMPWYSFQWHYVTGNPIRSVCVFVEHRQISRQRAVTNTVNCSNAMQYRLLCKVFSRHFTFLSPRRHHRCTMFISSSDDCMVLFRRCTCWWLLQHIVCRNNASIFFFSAIFSLPF